MTDCLVKAETVTAAALQAGWDTMTLGRRRSGLEGSLPGAPTWLFRKIFPSRRVKLVLFTSQQAGRLSSPTCHTGKLRFLLPLEALLASNDVCKSTMIQVASTATTPAGCVCFGSCAVNSSPQTSPNFRSVPATEQVAPPEPASSRVSATPTEGCNSQSLSATSLSSAAPKRFAAGTSPRLTKSSTPACLGRSSSPLSEFVRRPTH